ncbi:hypothetical protein MTR67_048300 [Solanum verrucosum]|uniref:Tf2-1-like SH3-like domain-containing protein n=1 Tax=Solanum verrucosum TaxID=315347 RepID=A0AAF0UZC5_SOLVR|nr:hypothetical protein MTR67_048300 [Solanum verrucosum]
MAKDNTKARTGNYKYSQQKSIGGNCSQFQQRSITLAPSSASVPSPRFRHDQKGPYRILKRVSNVAYELELPVELAVVHPVFHISLLKKCVGDPTLILPLESVVAKDSLTYEEVPVAILNRQVRRLRNKEVVSVKVLWRSQSIEGATWEAEAAMKAKYPHLFPCDFISS